MLPLPSSESCYLFAKVPLLDVTSNHKRMFQHILHTNKTNKQITDRLKNTRNQVEGQLWSHLMQLRDTLTVLLPDWYTQAKIARLSHKRENWSQVQAILFQNWGVVVSYQRTGVLSFPTSCISVDEDEFLHPEFRCRPSLLLLSALFARNSDAKVNFEIKHKIHLQIQLQTPTCYSSHSDNLFELLNYL